jgi:hypothetical protein
MSFKKYNIALSKAQISKISKAIEDSTPVKIKLTAGQIKQKGEIPMMMTQSQINKINKMREAGKGMILSMSTAQIRENKKDGGIIPFLIPIGIAAASAIAGTVATWGAKKGLDAIDKAIDKAKDGNGLYPLGNGLYPLGSGLYPLGNKGGNITEQGLPPVSTPNSMADMPIGGTIIQPEIKIGGQIIRPEIKIGGRCDCGRLVGSGLFPIGYRTKTGSGLFPIGVPSNKKKK